MSQNRKHSYAVRVKWTGNLGKGTSAYDSYSRDHEIAAPGKAEVACSSDPAFRGDPRRHNPEDLLISSLSACHMLWYLHLCAKEKVIVVEYIDQAEGTMIETDAGGGRFVEAVLRPSVTISGGDIGIAERLHEQAHRLCFIANSVNFPVRCEPRIRTAPR